MTFKVQLRHKHYDLSREQDLKEIIKAVKAWRTEKQLKPVRTMLEARPMLTEGQCLLYEACQTQAHIPTTIVLAAGHLYSIVKGQIIKLPHVAEEANMLYALLTRYLYHRKRHGRTEKHSVILLALIRKFLPPQSSTKDAYFETLLASQETKSGTYFSDCLSDDSDVEQQEEKDVESKNQQNKYYADRAKSHLYSGRAQQKNPSLNFSSFLTKRLNAKKAIERQVRHDVRDVNKHLSEDGTLTQAFLSNLRFPFVSAQCRAYSDLSTQEASGLKFSEYIKAQLEKKVEIENQARKDLKAVNDALSKHGTLTQTFLNTLKTSFVVAQYRGIHYITTQWNKKFRKHHRALNELKQPQYSSAVFETCGVSSYGDYLERLKKEPTVRDKLNAAGKKIATSLIRLQHSPPVWSKNFAYKSLFHLLQYWYSYDYGGYTKNLNRELERKTSLFKGKISSTQRPLLSTSDVPYHALKYAYGIKLYKGYEHTRLRPRWRSDGIAERPYSGKIYLSLHPIMDYITLSPSHVTSMFKKGLMPLSNFISSERETSFLGFMPSNRVQIQHIAKYPSFSGPYKTFFFEKYGLCRDMYDVFKQAFQASKPHTEKRKQLKRILGEYLCAFHEVKLLDQAKKMAEKLGKILIYRSEDGGFSLDVPDTPHTANTRLCPIINEKRKLYRKLTPDKAANKTRLLKFAETKRKLFESLSDEKGRQELDRLFTSKAPEDSKAANQPPKIFLK